MQGVRAIPFAVFLHLNSLTVILTVLGGYIVPPLALLASKSYFYALFILRHIKILRSGEPQA